MPLDNRSKLTLGLSAVSAALVPRRPETLFIATSVLLVLLLLRRTRWIGTAFPMVVLVFLTGWFFFDLQQALFQALRLFNLLAASLLVFQGLDIEQIAEALRQFGVPRDPVFLLTTAMRYVPLIGRQIRRIMDAQRARGLDLRFRVTNVTRFLSLILPLLVQCFMLSDALALALETRGFGRPEHSRRERRPLSGFDFMVMSVAFVLVGLFYWWERG